MQEETELKSQIKRNINFEYLLSKKKRKNLELSKDIRQYIEENIGYEIPFDSQERKLLIKFLEDNEQKEEALGVGV